MCNIKYEVLAFDHIVEFVKDSTVFAAARENARLRLFLIYEEMGHVYTRNGRADSWEELLGKDAEIVRNRIQVARTNNIPVYKINGSHN